MNGKLLILFLFFAGAFYGTCQASKAKYCNCNELTIKGKKTAVAYYGEESYTGKCELNFENGFIREERNYFNGQLQGEVKLFHPNGYIKEITEYNHQLKHGTYILYNESGFKLLEGSFMNNLKEGKWIYYHKITGEVIKTEIYKFGKLVDA